MNYLSVENLTYHWGDIRLFNDISFGINEGQKVALVARNGTGKTTLLKILRGEMEADKGRIVFNDKIRVGMLEQNPYFEGNKTIIEQVIGIENEISNTIKEYEKAVANGDSDIMGELIERMDALNAWDYEQRIRQILGQLKISDFERQINTLSGGQQKRVALAALLISEPDFIILDEPTNHLDLEIIDWLEEYLTKSRMTLLMVTHDRYFLDRVCNHIFELDNQQIFQYEGNYSYFLEKRQQRLETSDAEADKARNLLRKEHDWMIRQPQARGSKAQYRIDAYYELKQKAEKRREERQLELQFTHSRLGNKVVDAYNISKSFDGIHNIVNDFSYKFAKGEKVGIVGNNGSGKTTLLNMLTGSLSPDKGHIETGDTVVTGYYRQEGIVVDEEKTVLEVITDIAENVSISASGKSMTAPQFLRYFLFPNEMHHVRVNKLSGGEKKRLYLLTVLVRNPNFLILDEPTNDLDILTLNVLEEYLIGFGGTIIIVSHDRFFVDKIVDHIFVRNGSGNIQDFPGNYSEWIAYSKLPENKPASSDKKSNPKESARPARQHERKMSYKEHKELESINAEMPEVEKRKKEIEGKLSSGEISNPDEIRQLSEEYQIVSERLDELEMRWLELSEI
ncbi:MAG: ABC-F family ATP-binding cassette domain-containing protein [Marinilabiliaceae bacterium]|nr:ABC-F family ATP-binding cassette domain-containing protein [Marinilabiliaceae bacterium]